MKTCITVNEDLYHYMIKNTLREHPVLTELREITATMSSGIMQISPDQGQLMAMLIKLLNATEVLEIGTFTGYSALVMAQALPEKGQLITCDIDDNVVNIARRYWEKAGVSNKIEVKIGYAGDTLKTLLNESRQFDIVFIDADKRNLQLYFDECLTLTKPGGLIMIDNVLWHGDVINNDNQTPQTIAIRKFNKKLHTDERVDICMMAIGDGVTLARKR